MKYHCKRPRRTLLKDRQTECPDEKHRANQKNRAQRCDKKRHLLRTEMSDSREEWHLGIGLTLVLVEKKYICMYYFRNSHL